MNKKRFSEKLDAIPDFVWLLISFVSFVLVWKLISMTESGRVVFASPEKIIETFITQLKNGSLWKNTSASLFRVLCGYALGFIVAVPVAFLMGWYKIFRNIVEPWIQFIRNIPPIAYIPLVIVTAGVGEEAKITVIFIAAFLIMVITIYQGVKNVDETLIKAAHVLGAKDGDIFFSVVVPASLPFIMTALRLGLASSLTTLIASEMTGAAYGLGAMIQTASQYFDMKVVLMGIVIIGVTGLILERIIKIIEKRLTGWQEKREI